MTVGPVRPGGQVGAGTGRVRASRGGFGLASSSGDSAEEAPRAGGAAPLGALVALQEGAGERRPPPDRDAAVRRDASAALDALRDLQLGLLGGEDDPAALEKLTKTGLSGAMAADPVLAAVAAEVRLRARVELARRRRPTRSG